MAETNVEITVNNFPVVREMFKDALDEALEVAAATAEGYAIERCPVGTEESTGIPGYKGGSLKSTIRHERADETTMDVKAGGIDGLYRFVNYAVYNELGTVKMQARPFMKPAVEDHLSEYDGIFKRAFQK